eukprot:353615-Chlamydomonas_euryale.AAC.9
MYPSDQRRKPPALGEFTRDARQCRACGMRHEYVSVAALNTQCFKISVHDLTRAKNKVQYKEPEIDEFESHQHDDRNSDEPDNNDACEACGRDEDSSKLLCCEACPSVYHLYCLDPPMTRVPRGDWFCPKCSSLLNLLAVERFLDVRDVPASKGNQSRPEEPADAGASNAQGDASGSAAAEGADPVPPDREYFVKWLERSYMHCSWVSESQLHQAMKVFKGRATGVKSRLNGFWRLRQHIAQQDNEAEETGRTVLNKHDSRKLTLQHMLHAICARQATSGMVYALLGCWLIVLWLSAPPAHHKEAASCLSSGRNSATTCVRKYNQITDKQRGANLMVVKVAHGRRKLHPAVHTAFHIPANNSFVFTGAAYCATRRWEHEDDLPDFKAEIERFRARGPIKNDVPTHAEVASLSSGDRAFAETPAFLTGGTLHPYQLEGLNWLYNKWANHEHVILADEMVRLVQSDAL